MNVIILAAGRSARMLSQKPKLLHDLAGQPILQHIIQTIRNINAEQTIIVCGKNKEELQSLINDESINWSVQKSPTGTGSAARIGLMEVKKDGLTLILCGDMPLIQQTTLESMIRSYTEEQAHLVLLTEHMNNPRHYGRIIRDEHGKVFEIVEESDANTTQKDITEINCGVYCASSENLRRWIQNLEKKNQKGEYYLTDIVKQAAIEQKKIVTLSPTDHREIHGINNAEQLEQAERLLQKMRAEQLLEKGIRLADRSRLDIRGELHCEEDVFIDINCIFVGCVHLGKNVRIGPNCFIQNTTIGDNSVVLHSCSIENSTIEKQVTIGPFARIRPQTTVGSNSTIGNFVELKNTSVSHGTKIKHLTYIGDATLGHTALIGAGTIFCNFDGSTKNPTTIGDNCFIGSGSQLVAPLSIGHNVTIGAGSTITKNVPDDTLALTRTPQKSFPRKKRKNQKKEEAK